MRRYVKLTGATALSAVSETRRRRTAPIVDLSPEVRSEMPCPNRQVFFRIVLCNRNRSRPTVRSHFRVGNCVASARPSRLTNRSILPNMGALPPTADHRNKSQPRLRGPHRPRALAPCCAGIHRPRSSHDRACRYRSRVATTHLCWISVSH